MNTRIAAITCALAVVAGGCTAPNHATIEMFALCAPPDDATKCGLSSGECGAYIASARPWVVLSVATSGGAAANGFEMFTEVRNQMPDNGDPTSGRVNTNDAIVTGYELDFSSPLYSRTNYFYPANVGIKASSSFAPVIKYIPEEIAMEMASLLPPASLAVPVTVGVRLKGHLVDGSEFTTGTFEVTIDVINAVFGGFACPKVGDILTAVCPNNGQSATIACETPQ